MSVAAKLERGRTLGTSGCGNCVVFEQCGGHPLPFIRQIGCVNYANSTPMDTDDMNPLFPERFWRLWADVYGLDDFTVGPLRSVDAECLPNYIPQLQHRYLRRSRLLDADVVALRLFSVLGKRRNGTYAPKYSTGAELRAAFKLNPNARILLVGVDGDGPLEKFWAEHRVSGACESLAALGLLGVTVPNFSYFTCVPRFQILRNRKRILLSAERLSDAGISVSPHVNANTPGDWDFWLDFMRDHSEVKTVTMEFQTGARANEDVGREALNGLFSMQERLGRPFHPFLVGTARFYKEVRNRFTSFSIIDSQPFMQAIARQVLTTDSSGKLIWTPAPTSIGASLDDLMATNLIQYPDKLSADGNETSRRSPQDPNQPEFVWAISRPYFTAQPQALCISEMNSGTILRSQFSSVNQSPTV